MEKEEKEGTKENIKNVQKKQRKKKSESFIYNQIRQKRTESDCELRIALYKSDDDDHTKMVL